MNIKFFDECSVKIDTFMAEPIEIKAVPAKTYSIITYIIS